MEEKWLEIEKEPIEKTKKLMELLYTANLPGTYSWFDKLDCSKSFARQKDPEMTLEKFVANITNSSFLRFGIGQKYTPCDSTEKITTISLFVHLYGLHNDPDVSRFYWFFCPLNEENYKRVDELFKKVYKSPIDKYKCEVITYPDN